ncbi:hypothetical protein [Micromonospora endolithica]|uniref:hypothetical protein n=1 Tax=Micromonospora endolithica TaxID=230091 RepID=UPI00164C0648|nr:hypothetical protein [Micromonospora endolithica]
MSTSSPVGEASSGRAVSAARPSGVSLAKVGRQPDQAASSSSPSCTQPPANSGTSSAVSSAAVPGSVGSTATPAAAGYAGSAHRR